jgi:iron complex transport system ATP-binding protein
MGLILERLAGGYRAKAVFRNLNLCLEGGELLVLAGPNGSGKTTLLKTIGGLLPSLEGRALLDGREIRCMDERERASRVALLLQGSPMRWPFTVREAVSQGRFHRRGWFGLESAEDREAVRRALTAAGLAGFEERPVTELSGGEQQRVLIARARAQDAELFLLDEAVNSLDPQYQIVIMKLIRSLADAGRIVLMSLHDLNLASLYGDRLLLLSRGETAALGSPGEVLREAVLREVFELPLAVMPHPADKTVPLVIPPAGGV